MWRRICPEVVHGSRLRDAAVSFGVLRAIDGIDRGEFAAKGPVDLRNGLLFGAISRARRRRAARMHRGAHAATLCLWLRGLVLAVFCERNIRRWRALAH